MYSQKSKQSDIALRADEARTRSSTRLERVARLGVLASFARLKTAEVWIDDRGEQHRLGHCSPAFPRPIQVTITDGRAWPEIGLYGSLGSGEAYMRRWWHTEQLTDLVRLLLVNRDVLNSLDGGVAQHLGQSALRLWHRLQKNSRSGARRNIQAHYDLGDDLFECFLDSTMCYSSGIFVSEETTLEEASIEKMDRLCRKLDLKPSDNLIEIGTGWGGLAIHAAENYGCKVTSVTISDNQFAYAKEAVKARGLEDLIELRLQDYRDIEGRFNKLVSVEMIEAVGHDHMDTYFSKVNELLTDDGVAAVQAITIADQQFAEAVRSVDFIKRYIFPGGFLPSMTSMLDSMTRYTDLRLFHSEDIGFDYARTLACWRTRFEARVSDVRALGYSDVFMRMWDFYLSYCEGAFRERAISTAQIVIAKPQSRLPIRF